MKPHRFALLCLAGLAMLGTAVHRSPAQVLNIDFGNTTYSGNDGGPAGVNGTWTVYGGGTANGSLTLNGVTVEIGTVNSGSNLPQDSEISYLTVGQASTQPVGGIMAGATELYQDVLRSGGAHRPIGIRVAGLTVGQTYQIYLIPSSNTTSTPNPYSNIYLGMVTGNSTPTRGSQINVGLVSANSTYFNANLTSWVAATSANSTSDFNYLTTTVTIGTSTDTVFAYYDTNPQASNNGRPGFAALQVLLVPEPSTSVLLGATGLLLAMRRRRQS